MLTWGIFKKLESNLEWVHDAVQVMFIVKLVHGEAVPVLDSAVTECKAYYPASLRRRHGDDHFGQYDWVEFA